MSEYLLQLYWDGNFFVYLSLAMVLLAFPSPKRTFFWGRLLLAFFVSILLILAYSGIGYVVPSMSSTVSVLFYSLKYFLGFALGIGTLDFAFDLKPSRVVFFGICGYAIQHLSYSLFLIVVTILGETGIPVLEQTLPFMGLEILTTAIVYVIVLFFYGRAIRQARKELPGKPLILPFLLRISSAAVLSVLCFSSEGLDRTYLSSYAFLLCVTLLYSLSKVYEVGRLTYEKKTMALLAKQKKEQFEMSKKNIDYINIKCHDLRKQIALLQGGKVSNEKLQEIEKNISIYDNMAHTDDATLDTILSEKGLYCEREGIRFTCMADGKLLSFLDISDVCAIVRNLLDNAVEATEKIQDRSKRLISLTIRKERNLLHIECYNTYDGILKKEKDTIATRKEDHLEHGFGLKSIRYSVDNYNGRMRLSTKDDVFTADILITIPEEPLVP